MEAESTPRIPKIEEIIKKANLTKIKFKDQLKELIELPTLCDTFPDAESRPSTPSSAQYDSDMDLDESQRETPSTPQIRPKTRRTRPGRSSKDLDESLAVQEFMQLLKSKVREFSIWLDSKAIQPVQRQQGVFFPEIGDLWLGEFAWEPWRGRLLWFGDSEWWAVSGPAGEACWGCALSQGALSTRDSSIISVSSIQPLNHFSKKYKKRKKLHSILRKMLPNLRILSLKFVSLFAFFHFLPKFPNFPIFLVGRIRAHFCTLSKDCLPLEPATENPRQEPPPSTPLWPPTRWSSTPNQQCSQKRAHRPITAQRPF